MAQLRVLIAFSLLPALFACTASHECAGGLSDGELHMSSIEPFAEVLNARACARLDEDGSSFRVEGWLLLHSDEDGYDHMATFIVAAPLDADTPRVSCPRQDLEPARFFLRLTPPIEHEPAEVGGPAELHLDSLAVGSDGAHATGSFAFAAASVDLRGVFHAPPCPP